MNAFDTTWEEIHREVEWGKYPSEHVIRFVARNFYKEKNRNAIKILDFGCGGGAHTWYMAREGFDVYAFDGSHSAVSKVKERLVRENLSANLQVMDGIELNYKNDFFDSVIDNVSIYCTTIENIKKMYSEVYRVLKVDGHLLTTAFLTKTTGYGTGLEIEHNTYKNIEIGNLAGRGVTHFYVKNELENILTEIGFKIVCSEHMEYDDMGNTVSMILVHAKK